MLLDYLVQPYSNDQALLAGAAEALYTIRPAEEALQKFLDKVCQLSILKSGPFRLRPDRKRTITQLHALIRILEKFFMEKNLLCCPDIQDQMEAASDNITDLAYFFQMEAALTSRPEKSGIAALAAISEKMERTIAELRRELEDNGGSADKAEKLLENIVGQIQSSPDQVDLSDEQVGDIQDLITQFYKKTRRNSVSYRKALLDYQDWLHQQQAQPCGARSQE